jgi:uncharacterized membrane protein HdeD (DUF308 family)
MNLISRTITGLVMILVGIILVGVFIFVKKEGAFVALIYGIPLLIVGIFILLNKKEDKIERRKDEK